MDVGILLVFLLVPAAAFVWWLVELVDALKVPRAQWNAAGESQLLYVLLMVFLGVIGTFMYVLIARPKLRVVGPR